MASPILVADINRPLANFPPSVWGDRFSRVDSDHLLKIQEYSEQIDFLKEEVRAKLVDPTKSVEESIYMINIVERLGLSYHFEKDIELLLGQYYSAHTFYDDSDYDIHTVAVLFRVLRQHGFKISCDVFNKFKDDDGAFKETLTSDVKALLGLYEAAQLRVDGEVILDEALAFTTSHLESLDSNLSATLKKQVLHTLNQPLHKGLPRLEAKAFISAYEEDEFRNDVLFELAKLDFNLVQLLHQQELSDITEWWKKMDFSSKLSYVRDRIVECYFWSVSAYFEPRYALARKIFTKVMALSSLIDDTYDAYGTIEELRLLTDAIQRWDVNAVDQLPDYMKFLYNSLLNLFEEIENEIAKEQRSFVVNHAKEAVKEIVRCYLQEAEWFNKSYVPTFDEYMENSSITSGYYVITTTSLLGMGGIVGDKVIDWLRTRPKILKASEKICRYANDIFSPEFEGKRGHVATGIECYMKQYGILQREDAVDEFRKRIDAAWKDVNEECLHNNVISMPILIRFVNLSRAIEVIYKYEDGYTRGDGSFKVYINAIFVESITI